MLSFAIVFNCITWLQININCDIWLILHAWKGIVHFTNLCQGNETCHCPWAPKLRRFQWMHRSAQLHETTLGSATANTSEWNFKLGWGNAPHWSYSLQQASSKSAPNLCQCKGRPPLSGFHENQRSPWRESWQWTSCRKKRAIDIKLALMCNAMQCRETTHYAACLFRRHNAHSLVPMGTWLSTALLFEVILKNILTWRQA